ncbi:MAG: T9SS type A sorting domain-containing protein [Bacteroidia bacterium]|nr:T9SS type A sorting domain-containing protein [Bacteroidia bacterium]
MKKVIIISVCALLKSYFLLAQLTITISQTNVSCYGISDGNAIVSSVTGGTPPYTYLWSTGATIDSIVDIPVGIYAVTVTDANSNTATANLIITEPDQLNVVSELSSTPICIGQQATISASATGGIPPYQYYWDNSLPSQLIQIVSPSTTTTYSVSVIDANGCTSEQSVITVNVYPTISLNVAVSDSEICKGDPIVMNFITSGGNGGPFIYRLNGDTFSSSIITIHPLTTTNYSIIAADSCNSPCDTVYKTIIVHPLPQVEVVSDTLSGCEPLQITFSNLHDSSAYSYYWNFGDANSGTDNISSLASPIHLYLNSGSYNVNITATNQYGCLISIVYTNFVTVYPKPFAEFTYSPSEPNILDTIDFYNQSSGGYICLWIFGDGDTAICLGGSSAFHIFINPGIYNVLLIEYTAHGCSDTVIHSINIAPAGIYEVNILEGINIYPNPAKNLVYINGFYWGIIKIFNLQGQLVKTACLTNQKKSYDLSKLSAGVYIIKIKTDNRIFMKKLIKQ